jgi:hypothetical protein
MVHVVAIGKCLVHGICRFRLRLSLRLCTTDNTVEWVRENIGRKVIGDILPSGNFTHNGHPQLSPREVAAKSDLMPTELASLLREIKSAGGACNSQRRFYVSRQGNCLLRHTLRHIVGFGGREGNNSQGDDAPAERALTFLSTTEGMSWVTLLCTGLSIEASVAASTSRPPKCLIKFHVVANGVEQQFNPPDLAEADVHDIHARRNGLGLHPNDKFLLCLMWSSDEQIRAYQKWPEVLFCDVVKNVTVRRLNLFTTTLKTSHGKSQIVCQVLLL